MGGSKLKEDLVSRERQAKNRLRQSNEPEVKAIVSVRKGIGLVEFVVKKMVARLWRQLKCDKRRSSGSQRSVSWTWEIEINELELKEPEVGELVQRAEVPEHDDRGLSEGTEFYPESQGAAGLSNDICKMIVIVGLRGGSKVTSGVSVRGVANVAVQDWSDDFTFIVDNHCYGRPSPVARFLSHRVSKFHRIDATISELRLEIEVDDRDELFVSVLEAAKCEGITVNSTHRQTFAAI